MAWNTGGRYYRPQTKLWEGYVLTGVCDSVHKEWGVGIPACIAGLQAHTQGGKLRGLTWGGSPGPHPGGKLRGLAWRGVSRHTPGGLQAHTRGGRSPGPHGGIPACTEVDTRPPPIRRLLPRAVRILLECNLVYRCTSRTCWSTRSVTRGCTLRAPRPMTRWTVRASRRCGETTAPWWPTSSTPASRKYLSTGKIAVNT